MTIERDDYLITIRPSDDEAPIYESVNDKGARYTGYLKDEIMLMEREIIETPCVIELTQEQHDCLVAYHNFYFVTSPLAKIQRFIGIPVKIVGG